MIGPWLTHPGKPLTFNSAYPTGRNGRRYLSPRGALYKKAICEISRGRFTVPLSGQLSFHYTVSGPFITSRGTISQTAGDLDGFCKLLLDAVCEASGCDDSRVFEIVAKKVIAPEWSVSFHLGPFVEVVDG